MLKSQTIFLSSTFLSRARERTNRKFQLTTINHFPPLSLLLTFVVILINKVRIITSGINTFQPFAISKQRVEAAIAFAAFAKVENTAIRKPEDIQARNVRHIGLS